MSKAPTRNDEPATLDELDRFDLVKRIGGSLAECKPPLVIGVHGDWGAGKTSFLLQLRRYLSGEELGSDGAKDFRDQVPLPEKERKHLTVIWFEAWRYQHEKAPIIALLHEIRAQLPFACKALDKTKKLYDVTVRSALFSLEGLTKLIGMQVLPNAKVIQEVGEAWESDHLAAKLPSFHIREHLEHALSQLLYGGPVIEQVEGAVAGEVKGPSNRLVILIDDLDRCEPEAAFQLLEGIKIYLNLKSCVFVLAMNQEIIERAIAKKLKDENEDKERDKYRRHFVAREYLEKLCQDILHLPILSDGRRADLLGSYLVEHPLREVIISRVRHYSCLPSNPRKIKAASNVLNRMLSNLTIDGKSEEDRQRLASLVVIFACLYQFHYVLFRLIETDVRFYQRILLWSRGHAFEGASGTSDGEVPRGFEGLLPSRKRPTGALTDTTGGEDERRERLQVQYPPDLHSDPVRAEVFRIQWLILNLGEATSVEIEHILSLFRS